MAEGLQQLRDALRAITSLEGELARARQREREPIAVIGINLRTPFETKQVSFWEGLSKGVDASSELPADRVDGTVADAQAGEDVIRRGNFLSDVAQFDARFFAIAPVEAQVMDPQQRLVLESVWEALDDAGVDLARLQAIQTGVFLGSCSSDYAGLAYSGELPAAVGPYLATGNSSAVISGRVSYALGLTGPSVVLDTACSSSLVAVHLACESLRLRTSEVAIAGGVNVIVSPQSTVRLQNLGALSKDGRCRTFDASGTGYGRGEGCGVVILKRLSDALKSGDRILAVIRGSAVNQDGRSDGLTAPSGLAQQQGYRIALEFAKVAPGDVQYVEAHGTGTVLGDPIEIETLSAVFGAVPRTAPLAIGSVKSNIGHLEGAAGISGLAKIIACIQNRQLPPSLHFHTPNPHIPWEDLPLRVQTKLDAWPQPDKPLIAGLGSFGFSGTNALAIIAEAPAEATDVWKKADALAAEAKLLPLCISAKTPEALRAYANRFAEHCSSPPVGRTTWRDMAFTSCVRRTQLEHRLVVVGKSREEWAEKLVAFANGKAPKGVVVGDATAPADRAVFVFGGQGTPWWGMGRQLVEGEPVFRAALEECAEHIRKDADWSLLDELTRDESTSRLNRTDIAQPALLALQIAIARLLDSWGVKPAAVVGHSVGEIAAAFAAGILTLEQACRLATVRGRVMQKASGHGRMAAVRLSAEKAEALAREMETPTGRVVVGAYNSPGSVVVSGDPDAVSRMLSRLREQDIEARELRVDYAFHSPQMDPFMNELETALRSIEPAPARLPIVSTLTGTTEAKFDAKYWARQMREPVRFAQATQLLLEQGYELFVEVGAHPVLLASVDETSSDAATKRAWRRPTLVSTLRRDAVQDLLQTAGALHTVGYPVNWGKVFGAPGRVAALPSYPWQRQRYWLPRSNSTKARAADSKWALIHRHLLSSDQPGKHIFEVAISLDDPAYGYLADHVVQGSVWLPGAAFLELALEGASAVFGGRAARVEDVALSQALVIGKSDEVVLQLVVTHEQEGASRFRIASRLAKEQTATWTEHATGRLVLDGTGEGTRPSSSLAETQRRCALKVEIGAIYNDFEARGLSYGPAFQGIEQSWTAPNEALSKFTPLEKLTEEVRGYLVHPSLLDAAFQTVGVAAKMATGERTYVPSTTKALRAKAGTPRWAHATVRSVTDEAVECDVRLLDESGALLVEVEALRLVALGRAGDKLDDWLFETSWRVQTSTAEESVEGQWLVLADAGGKASALRTWLEARGAAVVTVSRGAGFEKRDGSHYVVNPLEPTSFVRVLQAAYAKSGPTRIVQLFGLDTREGLEGGLDERAAQRANELACISSLHLVQALAQMGWSKSPRLFVVTSGCQPAKGSHDVLFPEQALAWGFGATVVHEMPELRATLVDLDGAVGAEVLGQELSRADDESRVALRGSERLVPRLVHHRRAKQPTGALRPLKVGNTEGYRLDVLTPGRTDSLTLQPTSVPAPGPGQVVIQTRASGLNFRDTLMTLGMYPGLGDGRLPMGSECAGVVHAVGAGVERFRVGDVVVANTLHAFDAYVLAPEDSVVKKPASLSFEQAAALPSVVMTVLYALDRVGRLQKGESILIHAATGGVGLTAVHLAKHVGAKIYATAGSEEKRAYLRRLGIEHVYDSRTLAWVDDVKRDTGGRGVDVVLNSLAGEALLKGVSVLAPYGRFLELGKRDIYENSALGLYALRNNITVSAVALDQMPQERPGESRALLEETFQLVDNGVLPPLPVECFPISRAVDAFEHLKRARHVGKVVLTAEEQVTVRDLARSDRVEPDKTYLVTGGLGGLGLVVAKRLAKLGAKHLALMGRTAPSSRATEIISELEASGACVYVLQADVGNKPQLRSALDKLAQSAPPVAGIVHAAGLVDDAILTNLTVGQFDAVLAPKVGGALALDALLPDLSMRVYFASAAGVLGSAGQAHYAAANAFLDAFAHYKASRSGHALSLDWGAWGEVGLAARSDRTENLARQGLALLSPDEGAELFERSIAISSSQLTPMPIDFRQWRQANPQAAGMAFLRELTASSAQRVSSKNGDLFERLQSVESDSARLDILKEYLCSTVAGILRSTPEVVLPSSSFKQLGFDSLMTVGLKNVLERDLAIPISVATLFAHPTTERLATFVSNALGVGATGGAPGSTTRTTPAEPTPTAAVPPAADGAAPANIDDALAAMYAKLKKKGVA